MSSQPHAEPVFAPIPNPSLSAIIEKTTLAQGIEENCDIRDHETRKTVEHTLLASLKQLEASIIAMNERDKALDGGVVVKSEPIKLEPLKLEDGAFGEGAARRLEHLKKSTADSHDAIVRFRIRELLARDAYIISAAKYYEIPPDSWIKDINKDGKHYVQFIIRTSEFFDWQTYHASAIGCTKKRKDRTPGGASQKIRNIQKESIKCNCPAKFLATEKTMDIKEKAMVIDLHYNHVHPLASLEDIATRQKSERIKATIKSLLLQGSSIKHVMERLTMNYDRFMETIKGNGQQLSRDDFITYEDVYNIWYKLTNEKIRKDPNATLSAMKWMEEIENRGGFTFYDKGTTTTGVYFGFSTDWQLRQLYNHGRSFCFDGTHKVFGLKTQLFTIVLKNRDHGFGVPVAFLLTKSSDPTILISWLKALCQKMKQVFSTQDNEYNYKPNAVITDQGNTEILAIKTAFPGTPILYCAWHVLNAWERKIRSETTGLEKLPVKEKMAVRSRIRGDLRSILYEKDKATAYRYIAQFRVKWKSQTILLEYLDKNYFGRDPLYAKDDDGLSTDTDTNASENNDVDDGDRSAEAPAPSNKNTQSIAQETIEQECQIDITRNQKHWMFCYRQDLSYTSIDTNNYIESWHNTLKQHFFKQQRRVDIVIYVLHDLAIPHYQQKCMEGLVNVGRMNPVQRAEAVHLSRIKELLATRGEKGSQMYQLMSDVVAVESFTTPAKFYELKLDFSRVSTGHIISCACLAFEKDELCCKHIALLQLEIPHLTFLKMDREDIHQNMDPLALAPPIDHEESTFQDPDTDQDLDITYLINRIAGLEEYRDKSKPLPRLSELRLHLKNFLDIYEPTFPRIESEDPSRKRQRQNY
ncbi:hypothetical protein FBU30_001445 [Linnemannia zychae]|nr:hypothetical protein FBU30_001445 [Linnemannia zychae]